MQLRRTSLKSVAPTLREACEYSLSGKNKRIRPILALESSRITGLPENRAQLIASAFECLHTYSLVHDDLPAMDDDNLRRGQPSSHIRYGEATAILVGDLLQALCFEFLATATVPAMALRYFARAVGGQGMVAGQFADMNPDGINTLRMLQLKTGKLIEAAVVVPSLCANQKFSIPVLRWARKLGLLFQITDDLLDISGDSVTLGKTAGKDVAQKKKTIVAVMGEAAARDKAKLLAQELQASAQNLFPTSPLFIGLPEYLHNRHA